MDIIIDMSGASFTDASAVELMSTTSEEILHSMGSRLCLASCSSTFSFHIFIKDYISIYLIIYLILTIFSFYS